MRYTLGLDRIGGRRLRRLVLGGLLIGAVTLPSVGAQALGHDSLPGNVFGAGPTELSRHAQALGLHLLPGDSVILVPGSRPACRPRCITN